MNHIEDSGIESLVRLKEGGSKIIAILIQSAKTNSLLNRPTDRTFENRHVGCKEREKINRRRTLCTLRINFFEATQQTALFSKEVTS